MNFIHLKVEIIVLNNKGGIYIISGIYKITNLENNRIYIGESFDIKKRWEQHKTDLIKGIHINRGLQQDFNLYGKRYFKFEILQEYKANQTLITQAHLILLENAWISFYEDNNFDVYNREDSLTEILSGNKLLQIAPYTATNVLVAQLQKYSLIYDETLNEFVFKEKYKNVKSFVQSLYCGAGKNLSGSKTRSIVTEIEEYIKRNKLQDTFYNKTIYPYKDSNALVVTELTEKCKKYIKDNYYEKINSRRKKTS